MTTYNLTVSLADMQYAAVACCSVEITLVRAGAGSGSLVIPTGKELQVTDNTGTVVFALAPTSEGQLYRVRIRNPRGIEVVDGFFQMPALAVNLANIIVFADPGPVSILSQCAAYAAECATVAAGLTDISEQVAEADTYATDAAASATAAASSATAAAASDAAAVAAATEAASSASQLAASLTQFNALYLGSKSSDPSTDNNGNALVYGALYFNTGEQLLRIYTSSGWKDYDAAAAQQQLNATAAAAAAAASASAAAGSATSAASSASTATSAASTASSSASTASSSASSAATSASNSAASATAAASSQSAAAASATTATGAASTATSQAAAASSSASSAATSASNAANSASAAASSASSAASSASTASSAAAAAEAATNGSLIFNQQSSSYTLQSSDVGANHQSGVSVNSSGATNITIPPDSSVTFPTGYVLVLAQLGTGVTTVVAGSGVTILTSGTLSFRAQYSTAVLVKMAANNWLATGDFA